MSLEPIILAELQRGGPPLWVSGRTYPKGWAVRSPANLQSYVRKVAGAGDTDPSADNDNWEPWSKTVDAKLEALAQNVASITAKLATPPRKTIIYCPTSRTVKAPFSGWLRARIMGAAGSGAAGVGGSSPSSANGATVALVRVRVVKGDDIVVTLGAGGVVPAIPSSGVNPGNAGGTTTVTGPNGLNASVPGARGGLNGVAPAANAAPTGVDAYWLGGRGVAPAAAGFSSGGASAALLEGTQSGFDGGKGGPVASGSGAGIGAPGGENGANPGGSGGPNLASATAGMGTSDNSFCRLLLPLSGAAGSAPGCGGYEGAGGGFGGGGGGIQNGTHNRGGGRGGGGASGLNGYNSGPGGDAFVTLEFDEEV